jgi:acetyl esterase/lipase/lysophospholipase L1-like esterase
VVKLLLPFLKFLFMHIRLILPALLLVCLATSVNAQQKVIQLYNGAAPGSENWNWDEKENDHNEWNTKVVYNVSHPTLTLFSPDATPANGTAVIICPGGAFHALSINSEGFDVAKWLVQKGITCFVLKYRLAHSVTDDPVKEVMGKWGKKEFEDENTAVIPLEIADGRAAISYVRQHAAEYKIAPDHIGIIGFSAGGTVTASTAFKYSTDNRPDFVAPVYAYMPASLQSDVPNDAPPMFLTAAADDNLGLAPHSVDLYNKWIAAKHSAELHLYAKGGHGFGMRVQNIPTDTWIDRFYDWLVLQGFAKGSAQLSSSQIEGMQKMLSDWPNLKRYADENSKVSIAANEKRIVFMGNSITEGWKRSDSSFFINNPYIDRGISGQTTPQMLLRFRQDVIDLKPAVVVILAGINDIAQNTGPMTLEQTFGNIVSMAELARENNIRVVISSVLPAYDFPWRPGLQPAEKVVKLNTMLKDYATKNNVVYLDYFSAMADERKGLPKSLSEDGVHPTLAGYKIMEPLAQKAIEEALKKK